jgi:uncharacterized protein Veg
MHGAKKTDEKFSLLQVTYNHYFVISILSSLDNEVLKAGKYT